MSAVIVQTEPNLLKIKIQPLLPLLMKSTDLYKRIANTLIPMPMPMPRPPLPATTTLKSPSPPITVTTSLLYLTESVPIPTHPPLVLKTLKPAPPLTTAKTIVKMKMSIVTMNPYQRLGNFLDDNSHSIPFPIEHITSVV
mmetsp:Transcript_323/g.574  ORF Transcript_323/g.574 Transcript_323/m.574 type:complete len:140 (+) Transcript_323:560-979(+)